jgi:hypothetical protein
MGLIMTVVVAVVSAGCGSSSDRSAPLDGTGSSSEQRQGAGGGGEAGWRRRPEAYWTYDTLLRRIAGEPVSVGPRTVRIDPELVTCNGEGRGVGRPARWERFTCTQALLEGRRDVTFEVAALDAQRWRILNARWGPD